MSKNENSKSYSGIHGDHTPIRGNFSDINKDNLPYIRGDANPGPGTEIPSDINKDKENSESEVVKTVPMSASEAKKFDEIREELEFENNSDLFKFSFDLVSELFKWKKAGYKFFIGNKEKDDFKEVDINFYPEED